MTAGAVSTVGASTASEDRPDADRPDSPSASTAPPPQATEADGKADTQAEEKAPKRDFSGVRRRLTRLAVLFAVFALAFLVLRTFVVSSYYIPSASMEPTLHGCTDCNDDRVLVDKVSYRLHAPRQTDIVVFDRPTGAKAKESVLIKRVIGVSGDVVSLRSGRVYINGKALKETYLRSQCGSRASVAHTSQRQWKIRDNQVFVMGDNRCNSHDSRDFGPIPIDSIVGRAFAIFWPVGHLGFL